MTDGAIEIITGRARRRRWSDAQKLRIVAESQEPGACIKAVAARHDVYPSLVFNWRRQVREGRLSADAIAGFVPVRLLGSPEPASAVPAERARTGGDDPRGIAITLPDGCRVHISDAGQIGLLRPVLAALRG